MAGDGMSELMPDLTVNGYRLMQHRVRSGVFITHIATPRLDPSINLSRDEMREIAMWLTEAADVVEPSSGSSILQKALADVRNDPECMADFTAAWKRWVIKFRPEDTFTCADCGEIFPLASKMPDDPLCPSCWQKHDQGLQDILTGDEHSGHIQCPDCGLFIEGREPRIASGEFAEDMVGKTVFVDALCRTKHTVIALILTEGQWHFALDDATGWDFHDGAELISHCYSTLAAKERAIHVQPTKTI